MTVNTSGETPGITRPEVSGEHASPVEQARREHVLNPAAADAPPADPAPVLSGLTRPIAGYGTPVPLPTEAARYAPQSPQVPEGYQGHAGAPALSGARSSFIPPTDPTPAPKKARGLKAPKVERQPKTPRPPSKAKAKADRERARRKQYAGTRYRGGRGKWFGAVALVGALAVGAVGGLALASTKPSDQDVEAIVAAALADSGRDFPSGDAVMWAGQALWVWGSWDEANVRAREIALAPYLSSGMDAQAGWNEKGAQRMVYASVNPQPVIADSNHAIVDAVYQVQDGSWRCISLPVYAFHPDTMDESAGWAFALSGNPTPVACNPRTGAPALSEATPESGYVADGPTAQTLAETFFPGFFSAWGASDQNLLAQYTAPGVVTLGLGGAVASVPPPTIGNVTILLPDDGAVDGVAYQAYVPVTWTVSGSTSKVTATYVVDVRRDNDRWYVTGEPTVAAQSPDVAGGTPAIIPAPGDDSGTGGVATPEIEPTTAPESIAPNVEQEQPAPDVAPTQDAPVEGTP